MNGFYIRAREIRTLGRFEDLRLDHSLAAAAERSPARYRHSKGAFSLNQLSFATDTPIETTAFAALALLLFCGHFVAYVLFARDREFSYLRSSAIGIDIDGVSNRHREKFCEMAAAKLGKHIQPEEIKVLPVHENVDLSGSITRSDERQIFNDPDYWVSMPELDGAADAIRSIQTAFLLPASSPIVLGRTSSPRKSRLRGT